MTSVNGVVLLFVVLSIVGSILVSQKNVKRQYEGMWAYTISNFVSIAYFVTVESWFLCLQFTVFLIFSAYGAVIRHKEYNA